MSEIDFHHPRYRLLKPLGRGGMGTVWEATDLESGDSVAIKLLEGDSRADRRLFESEIRTLGLLQHENIVRLVDAGSLDNRLYLTMEYLRGRPLSDLLEEPGPTDEGMIEWLLGLTLQVLAALEYIHDRGIIHGDLKPSNIMVLDSNENRERENDGPGLHTLEEAPVIKLMDFGLARGSSRLRLSSLAELSRGHGGAEGGGTPLYMSPEQLASNTVTERSDLYSLGAMLYHLITRRPPFESQAAALTRKPAPPPPDQLNTACGCELARMLLSFINDAPHQRPATAGEAAGMLREATSLANLKPERTPRLMRPVFVGRERERGIIIEEFTKAREDETLRALRLTGAGGSGKSWLLHSSGLKTRAEFDLGGRILSTSFRQDARGAGGLGQILLQDPKTEYSAAFMRRFGPASLPDETSLDGPGAPGGDGSNDKVIAEAVETLRSMAARQPLMVMLEDIQYAPEADIDLLERLAAALSDSPILLLLSYRNEDNSPGSLVERISGQLDRMGQPPPLHLGGLDDNALREYAESVLSPRLPAAPGLLETLSGSSGESPLALHRTLSRLVSEGSLVREGDHWNHVTEPGDAKPALEEARLIDSLSPIQQRTLMAAGLIAETFDEALLGCLLEDDPEAGSIPAATAALVSNGLLLEGPDGFRLAPGLGLGELLSSASPGRVRELHERTAELLEENPHPGSGLHLRIAGHLELAENRPRAFTHFLEAARHGAKDYSNQLSLEAYSRALELAPEGKRPGILRELGELQLRCGRMQDALDCLLEVEKLGDSRGQPELWNGIARVLHRQGRLDEAEEYFRRCLDLAEKDTSVMAKTCHGLAGLFFDRRDLGRARDYFQRSLDLHGEAAEPRELVPLHLGLALIERLENNPGRCISRFKEALELARQAGDLLDIARIQGNLANTHRVLGETSVALEYLEESTRIRKLTGDRQGLAVCLNSLARIQSHRGEFQAALETTENALHTFENVGDRKGIAIALCNLGELLLLRGRTEDAREMLEECAALDRKNEGEPLACNILCNLARVQLAICEHQKAEDLFRECLRKLPPGQRQNIGAAALAGLAEIFLQREMLEAAEDALREAGGFSAIDAGVENAVELRALRMRLCRKRGDIEEAIGLGTEPGGPETGRYGAARVALELGTAYRELGPDWADKTEKYLERSLKEFESMGCPVEASEALGELSIYWYLTGEEEEAGEHLGRGETILDSGQLGARRSRFTERFKTR